MPLVLNGTTGVQDNSGAFVAGTAVASTSGTSIDFTSIPSWVKRITVMFSGVSTNGTSRVQVQLGTSGGIETTNYAYASSRTGSSSDLTGVGSSAGNGFVFTDQANSSSSRSGIFTVCNVSSNSWVAYGGYGFTNGESITTTGGSKTLSGALTQVRITTQNGTDTFDAGTINILYE